MEDVRDLVTEGQALLEQARNERSGRSSVSLVHGDHQRVVLMGLTAGSGLSPHESPPGATLQCITGNVRLFVSDDAQNAQDERGTGSGSSEWLLNDGDLVPIPPQRHGVDAISDSVILLTVSLSAP